MLYLWLLLFCVNTGDNIDNENCMQGRPSDTSAVFADHSMIDLNSSASEENVNRPTEKTSEADDQVMSTTSHLVKNEPHNPSDNSSEDVQPSVVEATTSQGSVAATLKMNDVNCTNTSVELDTLPVGINCSSDKVVVKFESDNVADVTRSVVTESIGVNAEKSSDDVLDVVIKKEIGEMESCPTAISVDTIPVIQMETECSNTASQLVSIERESSTENKSAEVPLLEHTQMETS